MTDTTNDLGISNDNFILGQILQTPALIVYEKKMREFNPFAALRLKDYEIRHTNALAWLLDTKGSHGLDGRFLVTFLSIIAKDRGIEQGFYSDNVKVTPEDRFSDNHNGNLGPNRLDIWLEGKDWVVAIEAKINSKEGKNQLRNYLEEIEKRLGGEKYKTVDDDKRIFLFLTVDKKMPENKSKSDDYHRWKAVSWLGLVAESLVIAIKDAIVNKSLEENSYKHQFLISYLDVIYEKSTKEFERLEATSNGNVQDNPSVLNDRNQRDGYLGCVTELIEDNKKYRDTLKRLKDQWEAAEKGKQSWEEYCQKLKMALCQTPDPNNKAQNVLANVQDFQSTLQFLLDQVDSTVEGRMRSIRDVINAVKSEEDKQVFEILSSSLHSISFIPKVWIGDENLSKGDWLSFLVQYKEWEKPTKIEFKLYFSVTHALDRNWRESLWGYLKEQREIFSATDANIRKESVKIISESHDVIKFPEGDNFPQILTSFEKLLTNKFTPAIALVSAAAAKVAALQS